MDEKALNHLFQLLAPNNAHFGLRAVYSSFNIAVFGHSFLSRRET